MFRTAVCVAVVCTATGCAARNGGRSIDSGVAGHQVQAATPTDSLEVFMSKVRARSQMARPTGQQQSVEAGDVALGKALSQVRAWPSAWTHRTTAVHYLRLGISDAAHEHFTAAVKLDSKDAASWDGLARIWRDWGFPHLALADASRAVYHAPYSPIVHNTLGTILQALGRRGEARAQYEKALAVDPKASYALTNLCYGWVLEGDAMKGADACRQALRLDPNLEAARNNLAVAYTANGDVAKALDILAASGDAARAEYNAGILHLARRQYSEALKAFDKALALRPPFAAAELMARETRRQLHEGDQP
jgi:Flp pilus assembly protein TadD